MAIICNGTEMRYHSAIVCPRSTFFAAAVWGNFKEGETKTIMLQNEKVSMVRRMMGYFYILDYEDQNEARLSDM